MKEKEDRVKHLEQDVSGLRATQDSLETTLATKETHTQHLVQDNTQLKESLASLQRKVGSAHSLSPSLFSLSLSLAVLLVHTHKRTGGQLLSNKEQKSGDRL